MCWQSGGYDDALKTAYMATDCLPLVSALFSAGLRCTEIRCFSTMWRDVHMVLNAKGLFVL